MFFSAVKTNGDNQETSYDEQPQWYRQTSSLVFDSHQQRCHPRQNDKTPGEPVLL